MIFEAFLELRGRKFVSVRSKNLDMLLIIPTLNYLHWRDRRKINIYIHAISKLFRAMNATNKIYISRKIKT